MVIDVSLTVLKEKADMLDRLLKISLSTYISDTCFLLELPRGDGHSKSS